MSVRAKFKVTGKTNTTDGASIFLSAVTGGSKENEEFFRFSPWGNIDMGTVNPEAAKQFEIGDEFFVDFVKAPAAQA